MKYIFYDIKHGLTMTSYFWNLKVWNYIFCKVYLIVISLALKMLMTPNFLCHKMFIKNKVIFNISVHAWFGHTSFTGQCLLQPLLISDNFGFFWPSQIRPPHRPRPSSFFKWIQLNLFPKTFWLDRQSVPLEIWAMAESLMLSTILE